MEISAAVDYVKREGTDVDRVYLGLVLGEIPPPVFEAAVAPYQLDAGAWCYPEDGAREPSVGATIDWMRLLVGARLMVSELLGRSADFLAEVQGPDGDWRETADKLTNSPQPWLSPDADENRLYFTAAAAAVLIGAGYVSSACTVAAADYLDRWYRDHGPFPGFTRTAWAALPVAASRFSYDSDLFLANHDQAAGTVSALGLAGCCWAYDMLSYAGVRPGEKLMDALVARLSELLAVDGLPKAPEDRRPAAVADAVRISERLKP